MKIAPLLRALDARGWDSTLVHTGQHYDKEMSAAFFDDLDIREPAVNLGVGSGTHATQTAAVLTGMERVLQDVRPDLLVVVGDVNSTVAAALAAVKLHIPVAHVEAGLRSGDRRMPEEINRILTDQLSALCLTPSRDGNENLHREGIERVPRALRGQHHDRFAALLGGAARTRPRTLKKFGVTPGGYGLVTLHRPSNVDDAATLSGILDALETIGSELPLVVHQCPAVWGSPSGGTGRAILPPPPPICPDCVVRGVPTELAPRPWGRHDRPAWGVTRDNLRLAGASGSVVVRALGFGVRTGAADTSPLWRGLLRPPSSKTPRTLWRGLRTARIALNPLVRPRPESVEALSRFLRLAERHDEVVGLFLVPLASTTRAAMRASPKHADYVETYRAVVESVVGEYDVALVDAVDPVDLGS